MSLLDLSFVQICRDLEVEAVEGGRQLNEFALSPIRDVEFEGLPDENDSHYEEVPIHFRAIDDVVETEERINAVRQYLDFASRAYSHRGLVYPFEASSSGDSLLVVKGYEEIAREASRLSRMVGQGQPAAKEFETMAFEALHSMVGGWGVCVGSPRSDHSGPKKAISNFRQMLKKWEKGTFHPDTYPSAGDHGADGFLIVGRGWAGPILFYQAKNTAFDIRSFPEEFCRMSSVFKDWFGKRLDQFRRVVPVLALNTVLPLDIKEDLFEERGESGVHLIDAVDILSARFTEPEHPYRRSVCIAM